MSYNTILTNITNSSAQIVFICRIRMLYTAFMVMNCKNIALALAFYQTFNKIKEIVINQNLIKI